MAKQKKQIALVVYPGCSLLELVAAHHIWVSATMMTEYETVVVGPTTDFMPTSTPLSFRPQKTYGDVPDPYAVLVIGGENGVAAPVQELVDYVARAATRAHLVGSFGTGAFVLAAAGLLQGKKATTHWAYATQLAQRDAQVVRQPWVEDGKVITGAGASAAVDMSLLLVSRLRNQKAAKQVQIMAEWDPQAPFGGLDWSRSNGAQMGASAPQADNVKTVALVIYDGLTVFDLVGPLELMSALSRIRPDFQPVVVAEKLAPVTSDSKVTFIPNKTFEDVPQPHVLIVPGGGTPTLRAMSNRALRAYIKTADQRTRFTTSVCTGALLLGSVGLLRGREATTHWGYAGYLPRYGARYVQRRWVQSGKIINSAGVSAGIDMTLQLIAQLADEETARRVQMAVHYDPAPPFGPIDYDRMPTSFRILQGVMRLQAPFHTRKPNQMLRQGL